MEEAETYCATQGLRLASVDTWTAYLSTVEAAKGELKIDSLINIIQFDKIVTNNINISNHFAACTYAFTSGQTHELK